MDKIDIFDFRIDEHEYVKAVVNVELISKLLVDRGLVKNSFGLCNEPYNMYFEVCHVNNRGVAFVADPLNTFNIIVNDDHSTRCKRLYYHRIQINLIDGLYHLVCLAQTSYYQKGIRGAKTVVYKVLESELDTAFDKIFEHVYK